MKTQSSSVHFFKWLHCWFLSSTSDLLKQQKKHSSCEEVVLIFLFICFQFYLQNSVLTCRNLSKPYWGRCQTIKSILPWLEKKMWWRWGSTGMQEVDRLTPEWYRSSSGTFAISSNTYCIAMMGRNSSCILVVLVSKREKVSTAQLTDLSWQETFEIQ